MILITGASGQVGRAVLVEVHKTKKPAKAMYRNPDDASKAPAGVPSVIADFADKASLRRALQGIETAFLVCSPIPQLVEMESNAIDACKEVGVKHVVLNSAIGAQDYAKSFPSWHRKVEEKLKGSGMKYTILRPNGFMQNIVMYNAPSIRAQGAFYQALGRREDQPDRSAGHRSRGSEGAYRAAGSCGQNVRAEWAGSTQQRRSGG